MNAYCSGRSRGLSIIRRGFVTVQGLGGRDGWATIEHPHWSTVFSGLGLTTYMLRGNAVQCSSSALRAKDP